MPAAFVLFCKTYRADLVRTVRLLRSVHQFNADNIPVVVCVPRSDADLFRHEMAGTGAQLVLDEDIVASHPEASQRDLLARYRTTAGALHQQVVKADAWRLLGCSSYLCMDADTVFLRPFSRKDFLTEEGHPYTVFHQSREFLQLALNRKAVKVVDQFAADCESMKKEFGRTGPNYDFGPQPLLWSSAVWESLYQQWFVPRGWTLWDAIDRLPSEIRWYGEAMLAFGAIPLAPTEPLFRVYHYDWQYDLMRRWGETPERVVRQYLGVVIQSNWDLDTDIPGTRSFGSRAVRRAKRWLGRWRR